MSKLIPTFASLVGAFFHHISGTDDALGFIGLTKIGVSADGVAPVPVGPAAPFPAGLYGTGVTYVDRSVAPAANATVAVAANASRRALIITNHTTDEVAWSPIGTASDTVGMSLRAGETYEAPPHAVPVTALSIWSRAGGAVFVADA